MLLFNNIIDGFLCFKKKDYVDKQTNLDLESCKLYNKSIEMIEKNCYKSALISINMSYDLNSNDKDILNLTGMVNLIYCNFDVACEVFYKSYEIDKNEISSNYINILTSEEFIKFIDLYNRAINLINEQSYREAIEIFNYISKNNKDLIEPYEILYKVYNVLEDKYNVDKYFEKIKKIDKENDIISNVNLYNTDYDDKKNIESVDIISDSKNEVVTIKSKKMYYISGVIAIFSLLIIIFILNKTNNQKNNISLEDESNIVQSENVNKDNVVSKDKDKDEKEDTYINILELPKEKNDKNESELMEIANEKKQDKDYIGAINSHIILIKSTQNSNLISESLFQLAVISEKIGRMEDAKKYYLDYTRLYSTEYSYYDESYYNLSMIYYNEGDLDNTKKYLKELIIKDPNSIYNNSKVKSIIND